LKCALALGFCDSGIPSAKARVKAELFAGALKRSFPRINAGAPTKSRLMARLKPCPSTRSPAQADEAR
jgi:hypothetical protein